METLLSALAAVQFFDDALNQNNKNNSIISMQQLILKLENKIKSNLQRLYTGISTIYSYLSSNHL